MHTLAGFLEVSLAGIFHSNLEPCPQWEKATLVCHTAKRPIAEGKEGTQRGKGSHRIDARSFCICKAPATLSNLMFIIHYQEIRDIGRER